MSGIYGIEQHDGEHFLVMELAQGEDLSARIERGPLPLEEATDIARQIASGLEAAHDAGIVHHDLEPANGMLASDGTVKILDFSAARAGSIRSMVVTPGRWRVYAHDYERTFSKLFVVTGVGNR